MLTIRLESRDSSCVKSNRLTGSRFARDLEKKKGKKAINIREGRKCRRFDSIRLESRDSSCVKSNRLTRSRFARDSEKIKQKGYQH